MNSLTDKQSLAAQALAAGAMCKEAAKLVGVTPESISAWKRSAVFVAYLNECRYQRQDAAMHRLRSMSGKAVEVIEKLMGSPSEQMQFKAAAAVLELNGFKDLEQFYTQVGPTDAETLREGGYFK